MRESSFFSDFNIKYFHNDHDRKNVTMERRENVARKRWNEGMALPAPFKACPALVAGRPTLAADPSSKGRVSDQDLWIYNLLKTAETFRIE